MAEVLKTFFHIGIYKPEWSSDGWPWHFYYEDGVYLSAKKRACGINKVGEFDTKQEAREFFHDWSGNKAYRMELIEVRRFVTVIDPESPTSDTSTS